MLSGVSTTSLGTIRHFPESEELKDIVINNSQLYFDIVTKIITGTFKLKQNRDLLTPQACTDFHEKGFFTLEDLDKVWNREKQYLNSKQLVALLLHLNILAPLEYEGKSGYFLPCALSHADFPLSSLPEPFSSFVLLLTSLLVSFECGFTPKGIFSGLVAYLIQHAGENGLLLKLIRGLLYRDQVSLWVKPFVFLTIKATPTFIRFSLLANENSKSCDPPTVAVRRVLENGLKEVASRLNYAVRLELRMGFECTCDTQANVHFTKYEAKPSFVPQCALSDCFCDPPKDYMQWFKGMKSSSTFFI